jgi:hypothetical protein
MGAVNNWTWLGEPTTVVPPPAPTATPPPKVSATNTIAASMRLGFNMASSPRVGFAGTP